MKRRVNGGSSVVVREMALSDMPEVFALGERLFTAEKWPTLYRAWDEYEITDLFNSDGEFCLVAETGEGRIVGFALGTLMEKQQSAWRYGWLLWLGVRPRYQGRGIAARLLRRLSELFIEHDCRMMLVDTDTNNRAALKFFRRQGFANEHLHTYLSQNFEEHPSYRQRRAAKRRAQARRGVLATHIVRGRKRRA
jgi:ribosomal protein S18 acetylase RimI-like enzyme